VASSKKYRSVCRDTVRRIAAPELAHRGSVKEATKATKRRLHQIYGAFEEGLDYDAAYEALAAAYRNGSDAEIQAACRQVMAGHSSTRERIPILDSFYGGIYETTGCPGSILDLGCGLNPLALPWMRLRSQPRYHALDIDAERTGFLNRYLGLAGLEALARCQDILVQPPEDEADLALLLKMSPSLERQAAGSTLHLLQQLKAPVIVVSFALKSLGGREKGMPDHYGRQFLNLVDDEAWSVQKLVFENELVFVVGK
jgi:16S rRNA (guanine(1405)-N(7))-methyltransferase